METKSRVNCLRKYTRFLVVFSLVLVPGISTIHLGRVDGNSTSNAESAIAPTQTVTTPPLDEVIDGAKNPEKIPDHVAFSVVFRVLANRKTDKDDNRARAYVNQLGLGDQQCKTCFNPDGKLDSDPEIQAMLDAADEFNQGVSALDEQAKLIKDATRSNPTPEAIGRLMRLQGQKEALVNSIIASLEHKLKADAVGRLRERINNRVKPNIKIRSASTPQ